MKKIASILIPILLLAFLNSCNHISATDPNSMLKRANLKLSSFTIESQSDNLDRTSSAWDYYIYNIKVKDQEVNALNSQLQELVKTNPLWQFNEEQNLFIFDESKDEDYDLSIYVTPNSDIISIHYMEYDWLF